MEPKPAPHSNPYSEWPCNRFSSRRSWARCPRSRVGREDRGCGEAAGRRCGRGGLRPDAGEHLCPRANPQHLSVSRELLALAKWLCPSQTGFLLPPLLEALSFSSPAAQTPTLSQHVLWCPFSPEVSPGRLVTALLLISPLLLCPTSPPTSSHQQIQLTS